MRSPLSSGALREKPILETLHGIEVEDPFRWLEDQDSPATRAFLATEQQRYRSYLERHRRLRSAIEARVRELLTVESVDLPVPDRRGGLLYLKRNVGEEQKAIYHKIQSGPERLLLSYELLGRDRHTSLRIIRVTHDGRYLVFALRTGGEDVQEIGIYDLNQSHLRSDLLQRGFYRGLIFTPDGTGFYYSLEELDGRFQLRRSVRHHTIGEDQRADKEVFFAGYGPALRLILQGSENCPWLGYLILSLESEARSRFLLHRLPPALPPMPVADLGSARFAACFRSDRIEALTDYEAHLGRVVSISPEDPRLESWKNVLNETDRRLERYELWGDAIVAHYRDVQTPMTRVYSASGKLQREVHYPQEGTVILGRVDSPHGRLFYAHSDVTEPPSIYAVDLSTGEHTCWWKQGRSANELRMIKPVVEKRLYSSGQDVQIPLTLVRLSGRQGPEPLLLSAYGGGGVCNTPKFSVLVTVLLEAGVSCAIAHVRGGGEGGIEWHRAAQKENKQRSVDDLIAAAEWLTANGYTTKDQLGVAGQSSGALLTLCAIIERPDLFRAAMALGPLADLTRFHLFGVAASFVAELGSPRDPDEFRSLYRLSPYHRVSTDQHYPAILIVSGDRDKRCDSLHARKMIARLRQSVLQQHPILLDYTTYRGHKPVLSLSERIESLTDRLTFLIAELGNPTCQVTLL